MDTPNTTQLHVKKQTKRKLKALAALEDRTMTWVLDTLVEEAWAQRRNEMEGETDGKQHNEHRP